jgi:hypothetical protein
MANGLEFSLEGMTEEQLRAARQFQQRQQGVRAARLAGPAPAASPLPSVVNTTAQSAARATAGPAGPSVSTPTATNAAPVATADAANRPNIGERIMRSLRGGGRALSTGAGLLFRGLGGVQAGLGVKQATEGQFGDAATNVPLGIATAINPVLGTVGNLLAAGRDVAMKTVIDRMFGTNETFLPQPAGGVAAASGAPAARTPVDAEALMRGTAVPERGTGAFRRGSRPAVTVDSRGNVVEAAPAAAAVVAPAPVTPVLGTEGGIFANAVPFLQQVAQQRGVAAAQTQARRLSAATTAGAIKERETAVAEAGSVSDRIKALADVQAALGAGKKVTADIMGNPIVTDVAAGTALRPTVREPITDKQIKDTMRIEKMTRAQVLARLREEGRID